MEKRSKAVVVGEFFSSGGEEKRRSKSASDHSSAVCLESDRGEVGWTDAEGMGTGAGVEGREDPLL